jgi:hypothetical protein
LQCVNQIRHQAGAWEVPHSSDAHHRTRDGGVVVEESDGKEDEEPLGIPIETCHEVENRGEQEGDGKILGQEAGKAPG